MNFSGPAAKHEIRIERASVPPPAVVAELEHREVKVGRVRRRVAGGPDIPDDLALRHRIAFAQPGRVPFEVGVVVAEPSGRIELIDGVAALFADEELRDGAANRAATPVLGPICLVVRHRVSNSRALFNACMPRFTRC